MCVFLGFVGSNLDIIWKQFIGENIKRRNISLLVNVRLITVIVNLFGLDNYYLLAISRFKITILKHRMM